MMPGVCPCSSNRRLATRLRFIGIDGEGVVAAASWMDHVIDAATQGTAIPKIHYIEGQRRIDL